MRLEKKVSSYKLPADPLEISVGEGLENRWIRAKSDLALFKGWFRTIRIYKGLVGSDKRGLFCINHLFDISLLSFAVDDRDLPILHICLKPTGYKYYADWEVIFIDKSDKNKGYSFHFGSYPLDEDKDFIGKKFKKDTFYELTLYNMLKSSAEYHNINITDDLVKSFPPFLQKNKSKYDIYIVFANITLDLDTSESGFIFRNIIKLNPVGDDIWSSCWKENP